MSDTWMIDMNHFLDEDGEIILEPAQARILGEYAAAIVLMASFPDADYPPEYKVRCRRRPNRKPCNEEIAGWMFQESDDIFWICPKCNDRGLISNWKDTMWDLRDSEQILH